MSEPSGLGVRGSGVAPKVLDSFCGSGGMFEQRGEDSGGADSNVLGWRTRRTGRTPGNSQDRKGVSICFQ